MRTDFDVIVVGGGLAGGACAVTLARGGCRVGIIERTLTAKLKVCGDFLSSEAQQYLEDLGIDLRQLGAKPITKLRVVAGKTSALAPLPFGAAGLSRLVLDEALLSRAIDAGAEVIRGRAAALLQTSHNDCAVRVGSAWFRAKAVGLATGKHDLRGLPRAHGNKCAFKLSFELSAAASGELKDGVQIVGYNGGYLGACNIEDGATTLCWLVDRAMIQRSQGRWDRQLSEIALKSPLIGDLLSGARQLTNKPASVAAIPYGYRRRAVIRDNIFPIGDQLAVIPSFTGDGTSIALSSGIEAARALLSAQSAASFQKRFHHRLSAQFRWAALTNSLFSTEGATRLGVAAISAAPGIATFLARQTRLSPPSYRSMTAK